MDQFCIKQITNHANNFDSLFNTALKKGVDLGEFLQPKGPSGPVKLNKKAAAIKETKAKKPAKKSATATGAAPNKVTKKSPTKTKTSTAKKTAAAKAANEKITTKKDATAKSTTAKKEKAAPKKTKVAKK